MLFLFILIWEKIFAFKTVIQDRCDQKNGLNRISDLKPARIARPEVKTEIERAFFFPTCRSVSGFIFFPEKPN